MIRLVPVFLMALLSLSGQVPAADWVQFRGAGATGISAEAGVPLEWSDTKNLAWKLALPGKGFSSPIVVGDKVLVTCYSAATGNLQNLKRHLVCADRNTGTLLWKKDIASQAPEKPIPSFGGAHGFASHTPVSDGQRVYLLLGNTGVLVFDLDGKQLWRQDVGSESKSRFGSASSPILYKNLLIVTAGAESESIRAFDAKTGKPVWKTEAASLNRTYSTPVIAKNSKGVDELVLSVTFETWGLDPMSGDLKWYAETEVDTNAVPTVVVHEGIAYVIGGRSPGGRAAIRLGGRDDVTKSHLLWSKTGGSYVSSPVYHKGHLYWVNDRGIGFVVDAKTGEEVTRKRIGGQFYSSMLLLGNRLVAVSRFGGTHVFDASTSLAAVGHNRLSDTSDFSGSPAVAGNRLYLRSDRFLYCIGVK
jgi:hypothetical protein